MADFLLEIGTEELPAGFLTQALPQWEEQIPRALQEHGLSYDEVHFWATPRRLALVLLGLPAAPPDRIEVIKGPAKDAAYDAQKQPTKALLGFMRSKGVTEADLTLEQTDRGAFVFARVVIQGRPVGTVLQSLIPSWITGLEGKRLMRWADGSLRFSRPIRWLVSLLDSEVLPFELEDLIPGRTSFGHRVLHPEPLVLSGARAYETQLRNAYVWVNPQTRRALIEQMLYSAASDLEAKPEIPADLLTEVNYLVEWPTVVTGQFDPDFLTLPAPVIKTEMISHQRYFPVHKSDNPDQLLPNFLSVSNGDPQFSTQIAQGNSRVLRARLWDGRFFYKEDRKQSLASFLPKLAQVTFQDQLGTVAQRVERICLLAGAIAGCLNCSQADRERIDRTALLAKADLTTQVVKEFTELQGIMGYYYAQADGEDPLVALGIREHYQPTFAGDQLPTTLMGQVVALADKADLVASLFAIGQIPTGSSDPYALRRALLGIIQIVWHSHWRLRLDQIFMLANGVLQTQLPQCFSSASINNADNLVSTAPTHQHHEELVRFYIQRLKGLLTDQEQIDYDLVDAVLTAGFDPLGSEWDLTGVLERTRLLQTMRANGTLAQVYETVNRVMRLGSGAKLAPEILKPHDHVDPNLFESPVEQTLYDLVATPQVPEPQDVLARMQASVLPVTQFFDAVLVMAEDPQVRVNRLNLLGILRNQYRILADFGPIVMGGT